MAKQSGFLKRMEMEKAVAVRMAQERMMQFFMDAVPIAMEDFVDFDPDKMADFLMHLWNVSRQIAGMTLDEASSNKKQEIEWTKDRVDRKLSELLGCHFVPWDERHK